MRRIVLTGGGFASNGAGGWQLAPLGRYLLDLLDVRPPERPRVCLLNTATGDDPGYYTKMYGAFSGTGADVSHLALFPMPSVSDIRSLILSQHLVYVGGGSVANLAALWRLHGLDDVLREAWDAGVVLSGVSAGALCWCAGGTTDSFGPDLRPFTSGLGLLPVSYCPHYDSEPRRRPTYQRLVGDGTLASGWGSDDGVGLLFVEDRLTEVVRDRDGVAAWWVERGSDGSVAETRHEPRRL